MSRHISGFSAVPEKAGDLWTDLMFVEDEYVVYKDSGIVEGPKKIGAKWSFLPSRFQRDINDAAVVEKSDGWEYVFIKNDEIIFFNDKKVIEGPIKIADKWTFLRDFLAS
jgi:hypothetical protein